MTDQEFEKVSKEYKAQNMENLVFGTIYGLIFGVVIMINILAALMS